MSDLQPDGNPDALLIQLRLAAAASLAAWTAAKWREIRAPSHKLQLPRRVAFLGQHDEQTRFHAETGLAVTGVCSGLVMGCQAPPRAPGHGPVVPKQSDKTERESVAVAVYNQNLGVVKDTRRVKLARGRQSSAAASARREAQGLGHVGGGARPAAPASASRRCSSTTCTPSAVRRRCGKRTEQVSLLEAVAIKIDKKPIFFGQPYWFRGQYGDVQFNQDFKNEERNKLGSPLPKGTLRVYKADKSGAQQFIGEDVIEHTPRDEKIRVKLGEAFDVVGDRKQTEWRVLGNYTAESGREIELRNHRDVAVKIEDFEAIGSDSNRRCRTPRRMRGPSASTSTSRRAARRKSRIACGCVTADGEW